LEPKNGTECAPNDNSLDKTVRNFAHQDTVAFGASGGACKSKDPQEDKTTEKRSLKDRAPLFNIAVIPLDSARGVFASAAAHTLLLPDQWPTQPASFANEPGQICAA
jgi:hypothetical protein